MRSRQVFAACAALLALSAPVRAQEALVLSGGGARGLAHVGVLLRLDELGYDPGIVTGNSMGAVVGALYAAGYSPAEIRRMVEAVDWSGMFTPLPMVSGAAREIRQPLLSFDLDVAQRRVSRGLFGEWRINRALVQLLFDANTRARGDFDLLPRRFRALAADLVTGEAVVLGSGDLARAVRASMAYPGFFAPVEWDGRVLIDGGIVDNLPTLEARALGASYLVAVDVTRPAERIQSHAPLAVVQRALNLMQINLHRDTIPPDEFVQLDIDSNFAGASFPDDPGPLIEAGYDAALRDLDALPATTSSSRAAPVAPERFAGVIIEAPDAALEAVAAAAFDGIVPGPYDPEAVLDAIDRLYASGLFQGIWPRVEPTGDRSAMMLYLLVEAAAPVSLSMAAGYDNDRGGRVWMELEGSTRFGRRPGIRSAAASFTPLDQWAALSSRVHSLSIPSLTFSIGSHIQERTVRTFGEDVTQSLEVLRAGVWLGAELPIGLREAFFTLAARADWIDPENARGTAVFGPLVRIAQVTPELVVGEPFLLEAEMRWGSASYARLAARAALPFQLAALRVALVADVRMTTAEAPIDDLPALGDARAVPGLRWGELRGRHRAVTGIDLARPLASGHTYLRLRTGTVIDELEALEQSHWVSGGEVGIIWPTPLGAIRTGWGVATQGDGRFTVDIGRAF